MRAAVAGIIARSATFEERVAGELVITSPSPEGEVNAICQAVGIPPEALAVRGPIAGMMARAWVKDGAAPLAWAAALETLLDGGAAPSADDATAAAAADADDETRELAGAFAGFVATAGAWLEGATAASAVEVAPAARRGLLGWLGRAWMFQAREVLRAERRERPDGSARDLAAQLASKGDGWLPLLSTYPVLARLVGAELVQWQRSCERLLARVAADWAALGEPGRPALAELSALALKRPPDGTPPLLVSLPGGRRVVYHDKDLRMAAWFAELVSALVEDGLTPALAPRPVLARSDRAWADFAEASSCTDRVQVERYYTRAGMYLRLFQAVRATDMHGRNVVAAGEHPMFIDLETVLQPLRTRRGAGERFDASPLASGLLPMWLVGHPGRRAVNVGGLNRGGLLSLPTEAPGDATQIAPTIPTLDGELSSMGAHLPHVAAGHRAMSAALAASTRARDVVARATDLRVAVLWRSGIMHKRVLDQSLTPMLLTDGRLRDAFLTRLVVGLTAEPARSLALEELSAIRACASPTFTARADTGVVCLADGRELPGVFAAPALPRVELTRAPIDEQRDLDTITTAIGLEAEAQGDSPPTPLPRAATTTDAPVATPLAHAITLANAILDEAVEVDGELTWIGASWCPTAGVRQLGALPLDLLSGTAGLAVLFAYLHRRTGAMRFRDAAASTLAPIARDLGFAAKHGAPWPGAFLGTGGQLYALRTCGALLDEPALLELAARHLASLAAAAAATPDLPRDVIIGTAGLLLVASTFDASLRPAGLDQLAARLREPAPPQPARFLDGTRWLAGLPDEDEGIAWALARWDGPPSPAAPAPTGERATLDDLVAILAARDLTGDPAPTTQARQLAVALAARRHATGRWLDDPYAADRHHLSAISGTAALALAFARIDAPDVRCCPRWLY